VAVSGAYVAASEVTALEHEFRNHTVELAALVAEALLAGAESTEVLDGLRGHVVVELEVDAAGAGCTVSVSSIVRSVSVGEARRTLVSPVHVGDLAVRVNLSLWPGPGAVEVALDDHVCGSGVEGAVESWLLEGLGSK